MKKLFKWLLFGLVMIIILILASKKHSSNPNPSTANLPTTGVLIALDADPAGYQKAANEAGTNFTHRAPTWNSIEKKPGQYDFADLQTYANLAKQNNAKMNLVFRPIDTGNRAMIEPYNSMGFDDPQMAAAIIKVFTAMPQSVRQQVGYLAIGNETDAYFASHQNEITTYAKLFQTIKPQLAQLFPNIPITVNFTYGGFGALKKQLKPITDQMDFFSFTYYNINSDFSVKDPKIVSQVISNMVADAGSKKLLIQEIGMPSSEINGSSQDKQADFVQYAFEGVRSHSDKILAVTFLWMNDLPQSTVDYLTSYYHLSDPRFASFLASLGYFDNQGRPKKAWDVFKRESRQTTKR